MIPEYLKNSKTAYSPLLKSTVEIRRITEDSNGEPLIYGAPKTENREFVFRQYELTEYKSTEN